MNESEGKDHKKVHPGGKSAQRVDCKECHAMFHLPSKISYLVEVKVSIWYFVVPVDYNSTSPRPREY
jgi:hypothetical protein